MKTAAFIFLTILMSVASQQKSEKCPRCCKRIVNSLKAKLSSLDRLEAKLSSLDRLEAKLDNLTAALNSAPSSCQELYAEKPFLKSQVYELNFENKEIPVYCHMGDFGCGDGGWTLAMKIDGTKKTFHYDSNLWSNKKTFNLTGGKTGFDRQETKMPTYWSTPFSKICLGMETNKGRKFISINKEADSLYSLIADGQYRPTSLGRNLWKDLLGSDASLQQYCNREGFNSRPDLSGYAKARIGILGNNENVCTSCDSRIGFGTGGYPDDTNSCGNEASHEGDNGDKHIKAMGYILVQ